MRKDRLTTLAEYLETHVPLDEFSINTWSRGNVACAMGHACRIPEFQKEGLVLLEEEYKTPTFEGKLGFRAVELFFEISLTDAKWLFSSRSYVSDLPVRPHHVAQRIWELLRREEAKPTV